MRIALVVSPSSDHTTALRIDLAKISPEGWKLVAKIAPEFLQLPQEDAGTVEAPLRVEGLLRRVGEQIYVQGAVQGMVTMPCSRCLDTVQVGIEADIEAVFLPPTEGVGAKAIARVDTDDLDLYAHNGVYIDLRSLIRDQVVLALPVQALCSEACAGLCQACGVNRNEQRCACQDEGEDSPFRVLKRLHFPDSL